MTADNIMYADGKVTLIKGDKVVQLTIGSNVMMINGVAVNMDVAAEIVDLGRTMLPFRWVAQVLGATVTWDEATQTVTMEIKKTDAETRKKNSGSLPRGPEFFCERARHGHGSVNYFGRL
ncbi:MAG: copper amine oxidase N-terminal domain-containing protein [Bacillota bacterium]